MRADEPPGPPQRWGPAPTARTAAQVLVTAALIGGLATAAIGKSAAHGDDFIQDYLSARLWLSGQYPYPDLPPLREQFGFPPTGTALHVGSNPHPPLAVLLAAPVAGLPFDSALGIYQVCQVLALAVMWHWACQRFTRGGWLITAGGGLLGLWAPVWQGLDWGQPIGFIALGAMVLWHLAGAGVVPGVCGAVLALCCGLRPFFAIVAATAGAWPLRRVLVEAGVAAVVTAALFGAVGLSPITWLRTGTQVGQTFTGECGSIPGLLRFDGMSGLAFFALAFLLVAVARLRGAETDASMALALALGLLTYPLAWFQYDVALLPVALWTLMTAHRHNASLAAWCAVVYLALRCLPNLSDYVQVQQWLQVLARSALVLAIAAVTRADNPPGAGRSIPPAPRIG